MSDLLRGNFTPKNEVKAERSDKDPSENFEREALRRLGGSIAYVSKKKFVWSGDDSDQTPSGDDEKS